MNSNPLIRGLSLITLFLCALTSPISAVTTAFTYQGRLIYQGSSFNGPVDLRFSLYDAAIGGNQVGSTITNSGVLVSNGLFTVTLDFGGSAFTGADRWLGVGVGTDSEMAPRQPVTSTPYALRALGADAADSFSGSVSDSQLSTNIAHLDGTQVFTGSNTFTGPGVFLSGWNFFVGTFAGDGSGLSNVVAASAGSFSGSLAGDVTGSQGSTHLEHGNAGNLDSGTLPDGRLSGPYSSPLTLTNASNVLAGDGSGLSNVVAASAGSFTGSLAGDVTGSQGSTHLAHGNAGGLDSGTLPDGRLSGTYSNPLTLSNASNVLGGDGSTLTGLDAGSLAMGTVSDARLSANVAKIGSDQTFSGSNVFTGTIKSISGGTEFYMVPKGGIILWSGTEAAIPAGWALCNGGSGTPDLRNRFVVGAGTGSSYSIGATGGATSHTHDTAIGTPTTSSAGAHTHTTATGTTGSESAHTHSINPPSTTSGSAGAHTHGGGTLQFGRGVDVVGSGSGGAFSINLSSGAGASFVSPNIGWGGATASGGAHTHTVDIASFTSAAGSAHSHSIPALSTDSQGAHTHTVLIGTITSTSADSRPPYYALCYIMKL